MQCKFNRFIIILMLSVTLPGMAGDEAGKAVGCIGQVSGKVTVTAAGGKNVAAETGQPLYPGDVINTGEAARALLLLSGQDVPVEVAANRSYTIDGAAKTSGWFSQLVAAVASLTEENPEQNYSSVLMVRGEENREAVVQISPNITAIREAQPVFHWHTVPAADNYGVRLLDLDETALWSLETADSTAAYPSGEPPLIPGEEYFLQVSAYRGKKLLGSGMANFKLLSAENAETLQTLEEANRENPFVLASAYAAYELYDLAIAQIEQIRAGNPGNPNLDKMLANIYLRQGKSGQARALLDRPD